MFLKWYNYFFYVLSHARNGCEELSYFLMYNNAWCYFFVLSSMWERLIVLLCCYFLCERLVSKSDVCTCMCNWVSDLCAAYVHSWCHSFDVSQVKPVEARPHRGVLWQIWGNRTAALYGCSCWGRRCEILWRNDRLIYDLYFVRHQLMWLKFRETHSTN